MWPWKTPEEPDNRPPTGSALAIAESLRTEPLRWSVGEKNLCRLVHDTGIELDTDRSWIVGPWIDDEPDANEAVLKEAIDAWVAARVKLPAAEEPKATAGKPPF